MFQFETLGYEITSSGERQTKVDAPFNAVLSVATNPSEVPAGVANATRGLLIGLSAGFAFALKLNGARRLPHSAKGALPVHVPERKPNKHRTHPALLLM